MKTRAAVYVFRVRSVNCVCQPSLHAHHPLSDMPHMFTLFLSCFLKHVAGRCPSSTPHLSSEPLLSPAPCRSSPRHPPQMPNHPWLAVPAHEHSCHLEAHHHDRHADSSVPSFFHLPVVEEGWIRGKLGASMHPWWSPTGACFR